MKMSTLFVDFMLPIAPWVNIVRGVRGGVRAVVCVLFQPKHKNVHPVDPGTSYQVALRGVANM